MSDFLIYGFALVGLLTAATTTAVVMLILIFMLTEGRKCRKKTKAAVDALIEEVNKH